MEPTTGIEPVNLILTKDVLYLLSYVGRIITDLLLKNHKMPEASLDSAANYISCKIPRRIFGAGNGTRTRDPQLGRLTL